MNEPTPEAATDPPRDTPSAAPLAASHPPGDLWERIKEHKVLQWGLAYLGAALALAHGADLLGHTFNWPEAINRLLLGVLIVGFPVALALAWYHGHRSLRTFSTAEATIVSLLVVIGAGLLVLFVRPSAETTREAAVVPARTTAVSNSAPTHQPAAVSDSGPSIAVLPFVNMSADREQEYFSDGLSEELLNELANVPNLRVIGRTSSFAFKGKNEDLRTIGETLGVNHILEGSVRKSADGLRITAQLINPGDGSHLWSGTYDRKLGDVFEIQEDIARTVAGALRISIEATNLREGGTRNLEAYDEFLRASAGTPNAIPHLEHAVQLDPLFTQAWAALPQYYSVAHETTSDANGEWLQKARAAENHVLALAPQSAAAKEILSAREFAAGNLLEAERLYKEARTLPMGINSGTIFNYGTFLTVVGRSREALPFLEASYQSDPIEPFIWVHRQINYLALGKFTPSDEDNIRHALTVLSDKGNIYLIAELRAMSLRDPVALRKAVAALDPAPTDIDFTMATLLDNAPAALAELRRRSVDPNLAADGLSILAQWAAYFGDPELSLQLARRAPRDDEASRLFAMFPLWLPFEKNVRHLPGFKDLMRELHLADYWRAGGNWGDFCHPVGPSDFECN
jgi:TolB-like protein